MKRLGADLVVEIALKYERGEWPRVVAELCAGDAELEALVHALLAHYDRPEAPLPSGPFPCELGPFTLERELGAGAHGKVYLARRPPLDGYVAVKLLRPGPGMSEFVEQVRREAGRARRIPSVHVVPVFDAGRIDGGPFYVEMAVCADPDEASPGSIRIGRSLREAPGLPADEAARLVEDLARAVHAAHRTGIVHGDVKPENVLLTPETHRVMLADFGIATSLAARTEPGSTPIGTVAYMAPEQYRDRCAPSEASDVYTLGGTLYFLLSGAAPHGARERGEDPPPPPLPPSVPQRLREIVQRALATLPEERPRSADDLAEELRRFRALEPTFHDRRRLSRRALLFARRHASELVAVAVVLALLLPLVAAGYQVFTGQLRELATREGALRARLGELDRARLELERETARLEGSADAKQRELARVEARLQQLPKMDQALGAARAQAEVALADVARLSVEERRALERAAAAEGELDAVRAAAAEAAQRAATSLREASRAAAERDGARERVLELESALAAARREGEERRAALERELRERDAALAVLRAEVARAGGREPAQEPRKERPATAPAAARRKAAPPEPSPAPPLAPELEPPAQPAAAR